jgi:hypothetical protein
LIVVAMVTNDGDTCAATGIDLPNDPVQFGGVPSGDVNGCSV